MRYLHSINRDHAHGAPPHGIVAAGDSEIRLEHTTT
jgi:hypothetical protein